MRKLLQLSNYTGMLFILFICILFGEACAATKTEGGDIERLKRKVEARPQNEVLDLPNHNFRSVNLDMEDPLSFKKSNFEKANFSGTPENPKVITNIDFSNCNLNGADFSYTIITKCKFNDTQLNKANFNNAVIKFTSFNGARLTGASLANSDQESVGFDSANLQCSIWNDANIYRVSFSRSDERGLVRKNIKENHCSHEDAIKTKLLESFKCP
jgi:uncharacterized protein YjbI with pentapeptide repeats